MPTHSQTNLKNVIFSKKKSVSPHLKCLFKCGDWPVGQGVERPVRYNEMRTRFVGGIQVSFPFYLVGESPSETVILEEQSNLRLLFDEQSCETVVYSRVVFQQFQGIRKSLIRNSLPTLEFKLYKFRRVLFPQAVVNCSKFFMPHLILSLKFQSHIDFKTM